MDIDNFLYIIIAIVLAIINGVAQKKKKADAQKARPVHKPTDVVFDEVETGEEPELKPAFHPIEKNPFEVIFGSEPLIEQVVDEEEYIPEPVVADLSMPVVEDSQSVIQLAMQKRAQQYLADEQETSAFQFEENTISDSAIGDALTEEEAHDQFMENRSDFIKSFSAKSAVIYAEIIKPKYFTVG